MQTRCRPRCIPRCSGHVHAAGTLAHAHTWPCAQSGLRNVAYQIGGHHTPWMFHTGFCTLSPTLSHTHWRGSKKPWRVAAPPPAKWRAAVCSLPVCITRLASQRAQPLEHPRALPMKQRVPGPPNPWNKYRVVNYCDPNWVIILAVFIYMCIYIYIYI